MVDIIETLDQMIVGALNDLVQTRAGVEKAARDFAFLRDLLLGESIRRFVAGTGMAEE